MRFKQAIYESIRAPLARPLFPYAGNAQKQPSSHQSLAANHQKRNRFRDSLFLFLESAVKFHFSFAAGGTVSAPAAASTAAASTATNGGVVDMSAGKDKEDGDQRHHSIDCRIHSALL